MSSIVSAVATARTAVDRILGRVSMYALIMIILTAIAVLSLVLAIAGVLFFSPLAWIVSLAVALLSTNAATWVAGLIVGRTPHPPSAIITGLLLFLIFTPSLDPGALGGLAIAGAVAGISKYLFAVRGRHLFNPAAIGALAIGIVQSVVPGAPFLFATWWVATPPLLPLVALGALVVLWRTSKLTMGLTFVVLAGTIVVVRMLVAGMDAGGAIAIAFGSLPIVFFAGFMLSEPLTLPPRRWQQLIEAVVVAALMNIPFSVGPIYASPELALLVGNLLAFAFGQHRVPRLTLEERRELVPGTWMLGFRPASPVRFTPGQYIELDAPVRTPDARGWRRVFSIASGPDDELVRVAFTVPREGRVSAAKTALLAAPLGAVVSATTIGGDFVLPSREDDPVLLVSGGIGVTPFVSQVLAAPARDAVLVLATGVSGRPPFADELEASGVRVVLFSPEPPSPLPAGWVVGGTGFPSAELIAAAVPDLDRRRVSISGPPTMVSSLGRALRAAGARRIHRDVFSGY
jgi:ferredoxin-NADP reductase